MMAKILNELKLLQIAFYPHINNRYSFSIQEKYLGAKILLNGYKSTYKINFYPVRKNLLKIQVDNFNFWVSGNIFKNSELISIYNEIFIPYKENPHAYITDFLNLEKGDIVIDAGACEGFFIKYALNKEAAKIFAFEPLAVLQKGLKYTFREEIKKRIVEIISSSLSDTNGFCRMKSGKDFICESHIDNNHSGEIPMATIDTIFREKALRRVDFIKMDVEGWELKVLEGAKNVLQKHKPKLSIAVYHKYENAYKARELIMTINPTYKTVFGGCYMFEKPYRPYMVYAY